MPDKIEIQYKVLEIPMAGRNLAASRVPELLPTVPAEWADILSREIAAGDWSMFEGAPIHSTGQNLQQRLEAAINGPPIPRPHWIKPVEKGGDEAADAAWLSGNLTQQGRRLQHLQQYAGSKAAGEVLWREEAARYSTTPGSTAPGVKPGTGEKSADSGDGKKHTTRSSENLWSADWRGSEAERTAKIATIIKTGTRFADGMAKAAGTVTGKPLRK